MSKRRTAKNKLPSGRQDPLKKPPRVIKSKKSNRPASSNVFQSIEITQPLSGDITKAISALRLLLQKTKKVIVISGAGISVNAGIPDFQTIRKSARISFNISVYNSPVDTDRFYTMVRDMRRLSAQAEPTSFHRFLNGLAYNGRLLRYYTQNINYIEYRLPNLWEKTVQLHGRIDKALYQYYSWNGLLVSDRFHGSDLPDCDRYRGVTLERESIGKRRLGIGRLRPNVVLYGEESPIGHEIREITEQDLKRGPEVVFVVGTGLKVPGARRLVTELCRAVQAQGGLTVWINKDPPPAGLSFGFDFAFDWDCDKVASLLLE